MIVKFDLPNVKQTLQMSNIFDKIFLQAIKIMSSLAIE
jgi:hypothetical protein